MNDEKELTIQASLQEIDNLASENNQLKAFIKALEEQLKQFTDRVALWEQKEA